MNIKHIVAITSVATLVAFGCTEAEAPKSEVLERAESSDRTLTSAVAPPSTQSIETKKVDLVEKKNKIEPEPAKVPAEPPKHEAKAPTFEPELGTEGGLTIQRLIATSAIERREPVAASSVFDHHDEKVYAFVDVSNDSELEKTLLVHFIGPDGRVSGGIELRIPPSVPRWRTWAYTRNAKEPGLWHVEIRTPDGALIGALPFEVEPGC